MALATTFKEAINLAFPDLSDVTGLQFDGTPSQAWIVYSRSLAIDVAEMARRLAPRFGVEPAGSLEKIEPAALNQIPFNLCQKHNIVPLRDERGALVIATANPTDHDLTERLRFMAGKSIRWVLAPPQQIEDAVVMAFAREAARTTGENGVKGGSEAQVRAIDDNAKSPPQGSASKSI